eukprot:6210264-Pleurochrysis_carterae.AAC.2
MPAPAPGPPCNGIGFGDDIEGRTKQYAAAACCQGKDCSACPRCDDAVSVGGAMGADATSLPSGSRERRRHSLCLRRRDEESGRFAQDGFTEMRNDRNQHGRQDGHYDRLHNRIQVRIQHTAEGGFQDACQDLRQDEHNEDRCQRRHGDGHHYVFEGAEQARASAFGQSRHRSPDRAGGGGRPFCDSNVGNEGPSGLDSVGCREAPQTARCAGRSSAPERASFVAADARGDGYRALNPRHFRGLANPGEFGDLNPGKFGDLNPGRFGDLTIRALADAWLAGTEDLSCSRPEDRSELMSTEVRTAGSSAELAEDELARPVEMRRRQEERNTLLARQRLRHLHITDETQQCQIKLSPPPPPPFPHTYQHECQLRNQHQHQCQHQHRSQQQLEQEREQTRRFPPGAEQPSSSRQWEESRDQHHHPHGRRSPAFNSSASPSESREASSPSRWLADQ